MPGGSALPPCRVGRPGGPGECSYCQHCTGAASAASRSALRSALARAVLCHRAEPTLPCPSPSPWAWAGRRRSGAGAQRHPFQPTEAARDAPSPPMLRILVVRTYPPFTKGLRLPVIAIPARCRKQSGWAWPGRGLGVMWGPGRQAGRKARSALVNSCAWLPGLQDPLRDGRTKGSPYPL